MTDILSTSKGIKALHEVSEVIFIPATMLAIWSQTSLMIVPELGIALSLVAVCAVSFLGSIGLYQFISYVAPFFKEPPLFPTLSVSMIGIGLIIVFQSYLDMPIPKVTIFTGFALVAWGFMFDVVYERVVQSQISHNQRLWRQ